MMEISGPYIYIYLSWILSFSCSDILGCLTKWEPLKMKENYIKNILGVIALWFIYEETVVDTDSFTGSRTLPLQYKMLVLF